MALNPIDFVTFDTAGFAREPDEEENVRYWRTAEGDVVILEYFVGRMAISANPANAERWRAEKRNFAARRNGAIVEVEPRTIDGCASFHDIVKVPQKPAGMSYFGVLTLPFRDFGYSVTLLCREQGTTGTRDTMIFTVLMQKGEVRFAPGADHPTGWMADPYDPSITTPPCRNRADDAEYDEAFPTHPLSLVRRHMRQIEGTMRLSDAVMREPADW